MFIKNYTRTAWICLLMLIPLYNAAAQDSSNITLSEGLKIVTEESRVIKIAKLSEALSNEDVQMARSGLLPTLTASASHTHLAHQPASLFGGQPVATSESAFISYSLAIEQILFDFRGSLSRYESAKMIAEAQKLDSTKTRNEISLEFMKAFYDLLESEHLAELAAKETARLEAHNQNTLLMKKSGIKTKVDLLQVQVQLADARQKHLAAKNLKALRAANLNNLLQRPLDSGIHPHEPELAVSEPDRIGLEKAWGAAVANRSEILIMDRTLSALDLEEIAKRSEFLPKLFVRGSNDYTENAYQAHENNWTLMIGISANIYDGGRSYADYEKTKIRKRQLIEKRAQLVDAIKLDLQNHLLSLANSYESILVNQDAVGQAEENLRINRKRYEEGVGTATDVLDAVTLLTVAETNQIRSIYDYRRAEASVNYAMGIDLRSLYR